MVRRGQRRQRNVQIEVMRQMLWQRITVLQRSFGGQLPFGEENIPVAPHRKPIVNFLAGKRLAAGVMHKRVARNADAETGELGAQTKIVVLEIAGAEFFVQAADFGDDPAPGEQTKSDRANDFKRLAGVRLHKSSGESVHLGKIFIRGLADQLRAGNAVGHRADQCNFRVPRKNCKHRLKPAGGDGGVVVEQQHKFAARHGQTLVVAGGKSTVGVVADDRAIGMRGLPCIQKVRRAIGRTVVHQNNLMRQGRVRRDAFQAGSRLF